MVAEGWQKNIEKKIVEKAYDLTKLYDPKVFLSCYYLFF
jgi:hypothetical protein